MALAEGIVAAVTAAVAVAVGREVLPRPRRLEAGTLLSVLLTDAVASAGASTSCVVWAPGAGRVDERLLRPGDEANGLDPDLVARLCALSDPAARWASLRDGGPPGWGDLPADHDPARALGAGAAAAGLRAPGAIGRVAGLAAARCRARWVEVRGAELGPWRAPPLGEPIGAPGRWHPEVRAAVSRLVLSAASTPWAWQQAELAARWGAMWAGEAATEDLVAGLRRAVGPDPAARLLVAVTGDAAPLFVRAMLVDMELRDRVVGVLAVGAAITGVPGRWGPCGDVVQGDLLDAGFRHEALDNEVLRRVPWAAATWLAPRSDGLQGLDAASQRWPEPGFVGGGRFLQPREAVVIDTFDLGALDADDPPPDDALTAALQLTVGLLSLALAG